MYAHTLVVARNTQSLFDLRQRRLSSVENKTKVWSVKRRVLRRSTLNHVDVQFRQDNVSHGLSTQSTGRRGRWPRWWIYIVFITQSLLSVNSYLNFNVLSLISCSDAPVQQFPFNLVIFRWMYTHASKSKRLVLLDMCHDIKINLDNYYLANEMWVWLIRRYIVFRS